MTTGNDIAAIRDRLASFARNLGQALPDSQDDLAQYLKDNPTLTNDFKSLSEDCSTALSDVCHEIETSFKDIRSIVGFLRHFTVLEHDTVPGHEIMSGFGLVMEDLYSRVMKFNKVLDHSAPSDPAKFGESSEGDLFADISDDSASNGGTQ